MLSRNLALLCFIAVLVWGVTQLHRGNAFQPPRPVQKPFPEFSFETMKHEKFTLSQFKDKPVAIHFWATWCVPCVREFPQMIDAALQRPDMAFVIISNDQDPASLIAFLAPYREKLKTAPQIMMVHDMDESMANMFGVTGYPETFILRADRSLAYHMQGNVNWASLDGLIQQR